MIDSRAFRTGYATVMFFTGIAGDTWRYLLGWWGWGALILALLAVSIVILVRSRSRWSFAQLPYALLAFVALCALSTAWSLYPGATALGTAVTVVTATGGLALSIAFSWQQLLESLAIALRFVLGLSIVFELYVSVVVREPILPLIPQPGIDYGTLDPIPTMLYWSRNELFQIFDGGKIQGVLGNSVLLSFAALLGIIVFALQFAARSAARRRIVPWLILAVLCLAMARSATVIAAAAAVALVALAIVLLRRANTPRARRLTYGGLMALTIGFAGLVVGFQAQLLALLGKDPDLTGRLDIWATVIDLAQQRPVFGWGWVSHWVPWVAPFDTLVTRNGVLQLHAHNAWIDVWFQLGVIGLLVFGALVLSVVARSWALAVDRPQTGPSTIGSFTTASALPTLVLAALLVQSLAESRLLVEFGMLFLVIAAVKTARDRTDAVT